MGEQSSSVFARAPVTVRSAFRGNVEERGGVGEGGREEGRTEEKEKSPL